jgi:hypothetical protein
VAREVVLSAVEGGWRATVVGLAERAAPAMLSWQDAFHQSAVAALRGGIPVPATFWVRSPEPHGHYLARRYLSPSSWISGVGVSAQGACGFAERDPSGPAAPPRVST